MDLVQNLAEEALALALARLSLLLPTVALHAKRLRNLTLATNNLALLIALFLTGANGARAVLIAEAAFNHALAL